MTDTHRVFCSDLSRQNDEPLGATASRIDHWFLVEYRGLWARDALAGSGLSDQVKRRLREQVAAVRHGRLLFVRRPDRRRETSLVAFAARSRPAETQIVRTEFTDYEDLRHVDLLAGDAVEHPVFLACTHGKHDACCARYGRPLYEALEDELDAEWVWQVSHIGGDRFAGNLVCLPEGIYYGRVGREDAGVVLDEHLARRIELRHYRGRSIYTFSVQAAERWVREHAGLRGIDDLVLERVERGDSSTAVAFRSGSERYVVRVEQQRGDLTLLTCDSATLKRPLRFSVSAA